MTDYCLTAYGQSLMERYAPLAYAEAARSAKRYPLLADVTRTAALLGLARAVATYREGAGCRWPGWARHAIRYEVLDAVRRGLMSDRDPRAERRLGGSDAWYEPPAEGRDAGILSEDILSALTPRRAQIVRMVAVDGLRNFEVAAALGISQVRVGRAFRSAIEQLRRHPSVSLLGSFE